MRSTWTFLTNHAHVLLSLAANPDAALREVAEQAGITERAAHRFVSELEGEGPADAGGKGDAITMRFRKDSRYAILSNSIAT